MRVRFIGNSPVHVTLGTGPHDVQPGETLECSDADWENLAATGLFERVSKAGPKHEEE